MFDNTQWTSPLHRGSNRKTIWCQKIFGNSFSFQATEMVLTSKWGRIQPEIQIWPDQVVAASWTLVRSPKHAKKMLIQLISATAPSWPAVHWDWDCPGNPNVNPSDIWNVCRDCHKRSCRIMEKRGHIFSAYSKPSQEPPYSKCFLQLMIPFH